MNFYSLWAKNVIFKCLVLLPQNFQIWPKKNLELPGCWEIIYIYDHYWWFYVTWNWFRALISQFFHLRPSEMPCIILSRMSQWLTSTHSRNLDYLKKGVDVFSISTQFREISLTSSLGRNSALVRHQTPATHIISPN